MSESTIVEQAAESAKRPRKYAKRSDKDLYSNRGKYYNEYLKNKRKTDPELMKARDKSAYQRRKNDPEFIRKKKEYERLYRKKITDAIYLQLGGKCKGCGFSDRRALQIDHVDGSGHKERKHISKGGNAVSLTYYKNILNKIVMGSTNYQILCANCNWIKRIEDKEGRNR